MCKSGLLLKIWYLNKSQELGQTLPMYKSTSINVCN